MKVSVGIVCSVLGATIAFYLAIISLVTLPADGFSTGEVGALIHGLQIETI